MKNPGEEAPTPERVELSGPEPPPAGAAAYTVLGFYLEPNWPEGPEGEPFQNYATSVFTDEGPEAAAAIAQRLCREDNRGEEGEDLLQVVAVIAGEHAVLAPGMG